MINRYTLNRALAQYDINGCFHKRPDMWRVVTIDLSEDAEELSPVWMPPNEMATIWADHSEFLSGLEGFEVSDEIVGNRLTGQTITVKYLFRHDATEGEHIATARAGYEDHVMPELVGLFYNAFGARLFTSNVVQRQFETAAITEPSQVFTGRYLEKSDVIAFDEIYFDNVAWAQEFFGATEVRSLLHSTSLRSRGYLVEERCGVDMR